MIADPTMLANPAPRYTRLAAGWIPSARTVAEMRYTAALLRNKSSVALINGDRNAAQVALSEAEDLEIQLAALGPSAVALDDILFLQYGSQS